ncbi:hypothetical protein B1F75_00005, partial [Pseudomonas syringae]
LERVKVYRENGAPVDGGGRGIYAQAFCERHPDLPVEEDGRLNAVLGARARRGCVAGDPRTRLNADLPGRAMRFGTPEEKSHAY